MRRETSSREWTCSYCRFENKVIHWNARIQVPGAKCRCCGSDKDKEVSLRITSTQFGDPIVLDMRIQTEWNELIADIGKNPNENQCDAGGVMIDSCPMIQKFFLMMKYYHIHIGKAVVGMDDKEEYCINRMTDLVENLQGLSVIRLVDMFEHIATEHRDPNTFEYFSENIGKCDEGDECPLLLRNRERSRVQQRSESSRVQQRSERGLDAVEEYTLSLFVKWHSFLFHPQFEDRDIDPELLSMDKMELERQYTLPMGMSMMRSFSIRYVDYGFGVWIDYTARGPSFECMKEEMMENEICSLTLNQWQSTLLDAMTHLDSKKIKADGKYTAKRTDRRYGIEQGQTIGIENILAILIYCNYTDLQARFSETFRKMEADDSDATIAERHCSNYYWLGRCVCGQFLEFIHDSS